MSAELLPANEDIRLACAFIDDAGKRAEVLSLYAFLDTLRAIPERAAEPLMGEIRLRWWYEAIEEIRDGRPVRYHPLTGALKALIAKYRLDPQLCLDLIEGQMPLLGRGPLDVRTALGVCDAGEGITAALAATVLGQDAPASLVAAVRVYAMARLKAQRGLSDAGAVELAHLRRDAARAIRTLPPGLLPVALPAALAAPLWHGRAVNPLFRRLKLLLTFLTGRL